MILSKVASYLVTDTTQVFVALVSAQAVMIIHSLNLHSNQTENIHISSFGAESAGNKQLSVAIVKSCKCGSVD